MKITFMNEIADLCERAGADVDAVRKGVGTDDRIGPRFLYPGIGYGGSCFTKDVQALLHTAGEYNYEFGLLKAVIGLNIQQQKLLTRKVTAYFHGDVSGKTFALWGLAFKPDTDDIRQAPAIGMAADLLAAGAKIQAYDPEATDNARRQFEGNDGITFCESEFDALAGADALLIATEWPQFRAVSLDRIKETLRTPAIFDGRNLLDPADARAAGVYYESIGRPIVGA